MAGGGNANEIKSCANDLFRLGDLSFGYYDRYRAGRRHREPERPVGRRFSYGWCAKFWAVGYAYRIGKYEVTVGQYTAFLNAVAATDTFGLYNPNMATRTAIAASPELRFR